MCVVPIESTKQMNGPSDRFGQWWHTLANSILIILFSEMLKFSKIISSESKNIVKDNSEYLGILHLLKWINYLMDMCWNGQGTMV